MRVGRASSLIALFSVLSGVFVLAPANAASVKSSTAAATSSSGAGSSNIRPRAVTPGFDPRHPPVRGYLGQLAGSQPPLVWSNGLVQRHPVVHLIYWGSTWNNFGASTKSALDTMYSGLSGSSYQNIFTQYYDWDGYIGTDVTVTSWPDTSVVAPTNVTHDSIEHEIANAIQATGWTRTRDTQFVVLPSPGSTFLPDVYQDSNGKAICGFHSFDGSASTYDYVPYEGDQPYVNVCDYVAGDPTGSTTFVASHEYGEALTDPLPNFLTGWVANDGNEIADLCATRAASGDFVQGLGWVTGQWSNAANACELQASAPLPHPTFRDFGITSGGRLQEDKYMGATGWSGWGDVGIPGPEGLKGTPAAVYNPDNDTWHIFAIGRTTGNVWHASYNPSNSLGWSWQNIGGTLAYGVSAFYSASKYHVYGMNSGGNMYHIDWNNGWGAPILIGHPGTTGNEAVTGTPAVVYRTDNATIHLFAIGASSGNLYHWAYNNGWGTPQNLGGVYARGVAGGVAGYFEGGTFHMYAVSASGQLYTEVWNSNGWLAPGLIGSPLGHPSGELFTGAPAATYNASTATHHAFAIGASSGDVYRTVWNGTWGAWTDYGGSTNVGIAALWAQT
jgi:hypothetical protein